jgi:hypothetical protein
MTSHKSQVKAVRAAFRAGVTPPLIASVIRQDITHGRSFCCLKRPFDAEAGVDVGVGVLPYVLLLVIAAVILPGFLISQLHGKQATDSNWLVVPLQFSNWCATNIRRGRPIRTRRPTR